MDSDATNLEVLAARVTRLESQNRRWKLAVSLLGVLSGSLMLTAAKPADRFELPVVRARAIEAQDFVLKDENGQVYARLRLTENRKALQVFGHRSPAALEFYDSNGDLAVTVPNAPGVVPVR